jgi:hypothetical protein
MKTTIEIKGYQIVINETEELVTVTAMKDDETVEEFSLELTEGEEAQGEEGIRSFDDFGGEEEDFGGEESQDEIQDEIQDELEEDDDDDNEGRALESFQSFINKKK